jgi:hypothetical protein
MDAISTQSRNPLHPTRKKHISETNFSFASVNLLSFTLHFLAPFYIGMTKSISQVVHSVRDPAKTFLIFIHPIEMCRVIHRALVELL